MSSPWRTQVAVDGAPPPPRVSSLHDVMSEELARDLQLQEDGGAEGLLTHLNQSHLSAPLDQSERTELDQSETRQMDESGAEDVSSDFLMAQLLQRQFDREHDEHLARLEKVQNRNNKVGISFSAYKLCKDEDLAYSSSSEEEPEENWQLYLEQQRIASQPVAASKKGFVQSGGAKVTKHDTELCGRRNVGKMEQFGPTFRSGDGSGMNYRLSNKVYKELKTHSQRQESRAARLHEKKDHSTAESTMDANTRLLVFKMANNGLLQTVGGCISTGKEANIYHAFGGEGTDRISDVPEEVALKIHKSTLAEFKCRDQYMQNDHRFGSNPKNNRRIINVWALKEFLNLDKLHKAGIASPRPVKVKKNVIVMSFIGDQCIPAPTLRDAQLSPSQLESAFDQSVCVACEMYRKCKLVHADLSEYNLLWFNERVYVIDVGQAVDINNPRSHEFLFRDCNNLLSFFRRKGLDVPESYELFNKITGQNLEKGEEQDYLLQIQAFESNQDLLTFQLSRTEFPFDYFYDKTSSGYSWRPTQSTATAS